MYQKLKDLELQYQGFLKTPFLWFRKGVFGLHQFENQELKSVSFTSKITQKLRLGKLVERFVSFEIQQNPSIQIIAENIQIQQDKITLGELDCLFLRNDKPIHLEIIYKFYVYDKTAGTTEIEHWIGPNKRDSFVQKLTKLKEKQLPLLYSNQCKDYLQILNLKSSEIEQQIYFKAQLFVPFKDLGKEFSIVNNNCICGFYIYSKELEQFNDCKFHIPTKHNWLVQPHTNINWLNYKEFNEKLNIFITEQNAPLCWLKKPNGQLQKFFVVWWIAKRH